MWVLKTGSTGTTLGAWILSPPATLEMLNSELARLYEKRLVVDELIQCLERYAASGSRPLADILPGLRSAVNPRLHTGL